MSSQKYVKSGIIQVRKITFVQFDCFYAQPVLLDHSSGEKMKVALIMPNK